METETKLKRKIESRKNMRDLMGDILGRKLRDILYLPSYFHLILKPINENVGALVRMDEINEINKYYEITAIHSNTGVRNEIIIVIKRND